jgi:hypothetical protein
MICEPKRGFRDVGFTEHRTKMELVQSLERIVQPYPEALVIRVVMDNLITHKAASLYEAFPADEARAIAEAWQLARRGRREGGMSTAPSPATCRLPESRRDGAGNAALGHRPKGLLHRHGRHGPFLDSPSGL